MDVLKLGGFEISGETLEYTQVKGKPSYVLTWLESLVAPTLHSNSHNLKKHNTFVPSFVAFSSALKRLRSQSFDEDSKEAINLLMKIIRKAVLSPPGHKRRTLRLDNDILRWRLGRLVGGYDVLMAVGFVSEKKEGVISLLHPLVIGNDAIVQCYQELEKHALL